MLIRDLNDFGSKKFNLTRDAPLVSKLCYFLYTNMYSEKQSNPPSTMHTPTPSLPGNEPSPSPSPHLDPSTLPTHTNPTPSNMTQLILPFNPDSSQQQQSHNPLNPLNSNVTDRSRVFQIHPQDAPPYSLLPSHFNYKIDPHNSYFPSFIFYRISVFSSQPVFNLSCEYLSRASFVNANLFNRTDAWYDVNHIFYKYFAPDQHSVLVATHQMIKEQRRNKQVNMQLFQNLFLMSEKEDIMNLDKYDELKKSAEAIKDTHKQLLQQLENFQTIHEKHQLLTSYSNILVIVSFFLNNLN